jgi:transposase
VARKASCRPNTLAELRREMARLAALKQAPREGTHPMLLMLARVMGIGVETADMPVHKVLSRNLRDQRAVARYGGITGAPDESGSKRREKRLARAGNARVRRCMVQLAWRWLMFQKPAPWRNGSRRARKAPSRACARP